MTDRPKLAVFKFASCDGCQLSLLSCEEELLAVAGKVDIAYFLEARTRQVEGPYDIGLVEGSITTPHDQQRIKEVRQQCRYLVSIGACASAGGIAALRNYANVDEFISQVYAHPEYIESLATSTAIADHVPVDYELRGCPINKSQLLTLLVDLLAGRTPRLPSYSVCVDCKRRHIVCIAVAKGVPCLGPITQAGCNAICPSFTRGCFGCYGPQDTANVVSLEASFQETGMGDDQLFRLTHRESGDWHWSGNHGGKDS